MANRHIAWAANRPPDIIHAGRRFWRTPHDHQPRILLSYWYSEDGPRGGHDFDIRTLPGYDKQRSFSPSGGIVTMARIMRESEDQQNYHAEIIRAAIDAGVTPHTVGDGGTCPPVGAF